MQRWARVCSVVVICGLALAGCIEEEPSPLLSSGQTREPGSGGGSGGAGGFDPDAPDEVDYCVSATFDAVVDSAPPRFPTWQYPALGQSLVPPVDLGGTTDRFGEIDASVCELDGQPRRCFERDYTCLEVVPGVVRAVPGDTFALDFRMIDGRGWELVEVFPQEGAPALVNMADDHLAGLADGCGTYTYRARWRDGCGNEFDGDLATVEVLAAGNRVSPQTCDARDQCGSVSRPWCELSTAIGSSVDDVILLTVGEHDVADGLEVGRDITLIGGYTENFRAFDHDHDQRRTEIVGRGFEAVRVVDGARLSLEGLDVNLLVERGSRDASTIYVDRSQLWLTAVRVFVTPGDSTVPSTAAIRMRGSDGPALSVRDSLVDGSHDAPGVELAAGADLDLEGADDVRIENSLFLGGSGEVSVGLRATNGSATQFETNRAFAHGAQASEQSVGFDVYAAHDGVELYAVGGAAPESIGAWLRGSGVVRESLLVGSAGPTGIGARVDGPELTDSTAIGAYGVEAHEMASATVAIGAEVFGGTVTDSDLIGGYEGELRIGAVVEDAGTLSGSFVLGAREWTHDELVGARLGPGGLLDDNEMVAAGPFRGRAGGALRAVGVDATGGTLRGGTVMGCYPGCDNRSTLPTEAIGVLGAGGVSIEGPIEVEGGRWTGRSGGRSIGVRGNPRIADATIVGNGIDCLVPRSAVGLDAQGSDPATVTGSEVRGGYARDRSAGVTGESVEILESTIAGGVALQALGVDADLVHVDRSLVFACGADAVGHVGCERARGGAGLRAGTTQVSGSVVLADVRGPGCDAEAADIRYAICGTSWPGQAAVAGLDDAATIRGAILLAVDGPAIVADDAELDTLNIEGTVFPEGVEPLLYREEGTDRLVADVVELNELVFGEGVALPTHNFALDPFDPPVVPSASPLDYAPQVECWLLRGRAPSASVDYLDGQDASDRSPGAMGCPGPPPASGDLTFVGCPRRTLALNCPMGHECFIDLHCGQRSGCAVAMCTDGGDGDPCLDSVDCNFANVCVGACDGPMCTGICP